MVMDAYNKLILHDILRSGCEEVIGRSLRKLVSTTVNILVKIKLFSDVRISKTEFYVNT